MSDIDDLVKLQQLLDGGAITREEFDREKNWILENRHAQANEKRTEAARAARQEKTYTGYNTDGRAQKQTAGRTENRQNRSVQGKGNQVQQSRGAGNGKTQQDNQGCPRWLKILIIVFSIFVTWPIAFILILVKKPFDKRVNVILAMWNGIASVVLIASIARTVTLVQVQNQAGSTVAEGVTSQLADSGDASYEQFLTELDSTLKTSYGDRYSITDNGTTLTISIWQDGVADEASYVLEGNEESAQAWDNLKSSLENLSFTCFTEANSASPERHVVLNVLNDQNTENVLLSYLDGSCVYDVVASTQAGNSDSGNSDSASTETGN